MKGIPKFLIPLLIIVVLILLFWNSCETKNNGNTRVSPQTSDTTKPPVELPKPTKPPKPTDPPVDPPVDPAKPTDTSKPPQPTEPAKPPLEIYFFDQNKRPKDKGIQGTSYTAKVYVIDNVRKKRFGPYRGSTYPNTKPLENDRPNTAAPVVHLFNNRNGHKGQTRKGLNLVDLKGIRKIPGNSWMGNPRKMTYVNVHSGYSDKGNYNSRGSLGCPTIHPKEITKFMSHFDFSIKNHENPPEKTMGTSAGIVCLLRLNNSDRNTFIKEIETIY